MSFVIEDLDLVGDEGLIPSGDRAEVLRADWGRGVRDVYLLRAGESVWVVPGRWVGGATNLLALIFLLLRLRRRTLFFLHFALILNASRC